MVGILEQYEFHGCFAEFFVGQHAVFDEYADVGPFFLEVLAVGLEQLVEARRNLFGDV